MAESINKTTLKCLTLGNADLGINIISDKLYAQILPFALKTLLRNLSNNNNNNNDDEDKQYEAIVLKNNNPADNKVLDFYTHLLVFLTHCARNDLSINEVKSLLSNDNILNEERITALITTYQDNVVDLRYEMMKYRITCATIIDFSWRLDYNVHSNVMEDIKDQTYILTFVIIDNGVKKDITFNCDLAQMNDLFSHVKDALGKKKTE